MDLQGDFGQGNQFRAENDTVVSRLAQQDKVPWYRKPNLRFLYMLMIPTCLGVEMTSGYDGSMVNGLQAVPSWLEYYHPHSVSLGLMASMYSLGGVAAVPFTPFIVNKVGRRYPILLGGVISIVGGMLQGFALNFTMFIIARFVLGFAVILALVAASSLIGELSHPKERAAMNSFFNAFYFLGAIIAAAVTLYSFSMTSNWGWRIPSLLQVMPSLLQVVFIWFIPESPRWLISKGREDEAFTILVKYHAEGDENSEFVQAEYSQIVRMLEMGPKVGQMNSETVILSSKMQRRIIITVFLGLCVPWNGSAMISSFLAPILDNIGIHDNGTKNIINLAIVSWKFTNSAIFALIASRYPRRRMFLTSVIALFSVLVAFTAASADYSSTRNSVSAGVVLVLIFLHSPAFNVGFGPLNITFLTELFPFHARASGLALYQWSYRGGNFLVQLINPIGLDIAGWRWYITYCAWNAFAIIVICFTFPETSGRTLEELTFLFEEDRELLRDAEVGPLREHGGRERYGTMEDG